MKTETKAEAVTGESESAENSAAESEEGASGTKEKASRPARRGASISMPVSTLIASVLAVLMVVVAGILGGFLWSARGDLAQRDARSADGDRAEQLATKYAVGAATIKFDDINSWIGQLKAGTSPQLADKFDATAPKLEEILTPLKWTSTASPIAATVASVNGGIYKVDVFVNVSSTNAQNPQGAQTTVTYDITLDKNSDWQITDVGGVNAALPVK